MQFVLGRRRVGLVEVDFGRFFLELKYLRLLLALLSLKTVLQVLEVVVKLLLVLARWTVLYLRIWLFLDLWRCWYLWALLFPIEFGEVKFLLLNKLDITFARTHNVLTIISFTVVVLGLAEGESSLSCEVFLDLKLLIIPDAIQNPLVLELAAL